MRPPHIFYKLQISFLDSRISTTEFSNCPISTGWRGFLPVLDTRDPNNFFIGTWTDRWTNSKLPGNLWRGFEFLKAEREQDKRQDPLNIRDKGFLHVKLNLKCTLVYLEEKN
jgi:hypothetical protein